MAKATYTPWVDWDNSGIFDSASGAYENLSGYTLAAPGVSWAHGNDVARALNPPMAGTARLTLNNTSHVFSRANAAGDLYGDLKARRRYRLQATSGGSTYDQWHGLTEDLQEAIRAGLNVVELPGIGGLSRLSGRRGSGGRGFSQLYTSITTGVAIRRLLDAVGWPKTLHYLVTDAPGAFVYTLEGLGTALTGYWHLGEASGDVQDSSARNYDGVVTLGGGTRAAAALDDQGDGSITFDGAATKVVVADATWIRKIWSDPTQGGAIAFCANADATVGGTRPILAKEDALLTKGWRLYLTNVYGGVALAFQCLFSGQAGIWRTTATTLPTTSLLAGVLTYNADDVANDPTVYLWDGTNGYRVLTVGDGLTEVQAPLGAVVDDTGGDLLIGTEGLGANFFDGRIDEVAVWWGTLTAAEARSYIERVLWCPRVLDDGQTTLAWWWLSASEDALAHLSQLLMAEGPGACIYEDRSGRLHFEGRRYRLLTTRCTTSQATFRNSGAEPLHAAPCLPAQNAASVINYCQLSYKIRSAKGSQQVWACGETLTFAPNERRYFVANLDDPAQTAIAPSEGAGDFTVTAGAISTVYLYGDGSGQDIPFYMIAGAAGATVTGLILRAQPVTVDTTTRVVHTLDTSSSQQAYGLRGFGQSLWPELSSLNDMQGLADAIVALYQTPQTTLQMGLNNGADARLTQLLTRQISDRVTVVESGSGINGDYFLERMTHEVRAGGAEHRAVFDLAACGSWADEMFVLDSAANGVLDTNRLGF